MGTIPTISTFTAGAVLTAAQVNAIKDASDFWALTPRCSVYSSAALSVPTGASTWTVVPFASETFDIVQSGDSPSHDTATNNSRIYVRTSGKYEINGQLQIALNATGYRSVQVRLNAAGSGTGGTQLAVNTVDASSAALVSLPIPTVEYDLTAGDYVEMFVQQNSGGSLNTVTGAGITFLRVKLTGA